MTPKDEALQIMIQFSLDQFAKTRPHPAYEGQTWESLLEMTVRDQCRELIADLERHGIYFSDEDDDMHPFWGTYDPDDYIEGIDIPNKREPEYQI